MNLPSTTEAGRTTGVPDLIREEIRLSIIRIVNILAGVTFALAFVFGNILYQMTHERKILDGASVEALLCVFVLFLNYRKKLQAAILLTFFIHCASTLYFGLILGPSAQIQGMAIFLGGMAFLIFQSWPVRGIAAFLIVSLLVTVEINYVYHFVSTVPLYQQENMLRRMVISTVVFLNCLIFYFVVREVIRYRDRSTAYMLQLQEARQALSRYVRESSHQMRNDLSVIYSVVQHSLDGKRVQDVRIIPIPKTHLRAIHSSCKAVIDHLNTGLEWSRIEAGVEAPLHRQAFDLHKWLGETEERFRLAALSRPAHLVLNTLPSLPQYILADRGRMDIIISNLLSNAIKFTRKHTTITLKAYTVDEELHLFVTDQGKGIQPNRLESIFEPFTTEGGTMTGTGLGLPVARKTARALGGDLVVSSDLSRGTTFMVRLPFATANAAQVAEAQPVPDDFEGISVLIADDNTMSLKLMQVNLEGMKMEIYTTETADETMKKLANTPAIDLVIVDNHLPDGTGIEITRWIKTNPALKHIPVVIMSGDAYAGGPSDVRRQALEAGASAYFPKPITYQELYIEIERLIRPPMWTE